MKNLKTFILQTANQSFAADDGDTVFSEGSTRAMNNQDRMLVFSMVRELKLNTFRKWEPVYTGIQQHIKSMVFEEALSDDQIMKVANEFTLIWFQYPDGLIKELIDNINDIDRMAYLLICKAAGNIPKGVNRDSEISSDKQDQKIKLIIQLCEKNKKNACEATKQSPLQKQSLVTGNKYRADIKVPKNGANVTCGGCIVS